MKLLHSISPSPLAAFTVGLFLVVSLVAGPASADAGRQLTLRYLHDLDCGTAAMAASPESTARFEARLLKRAPASQHDAERAARGQALARRSIGCEHVQHQVRDISIQYDPNTNALLQHAAAAGDRFARLRADTSRVDGPANVERTRALLYEAVHAGDALAISEIGRSLALSHDPGQFGSTTMAGDMANADTWLLVACDLGLDCAATSREFDRWCLHYGGGCAQTDLAGAIRLVHGEQYFNRIDAQRRILAERIRHQDWQGMFAPLVTAVPL